jgi:hypothetical protein
MSSSRTAAPPAQTVASRITPSRVYRPSPSRLSPAGTHRAGTQPNTQSSPCAARAAARPARQRPRPAGAAARRAEPRPPHRTIARSWTPSAEAALLGRVSVIRQARARSTTACSRSAAALARSWATAARSRTAAADPAPPPAPRRPCASQSPSRPGPRPPPPDGSRPRDLAPLPPSRAAPQPSPAGGPPAPGRRRACRASARCRRWCRPSRPALGGGHDVLVPSWRD